MSSLKPKGSECRIYVGNLPQYVRSRDLKHLFDKYGPITDVDIHNKLDPAFAFIEFEDPRDAQDAIHGRDNERFEGNRIKVEFPRNGNTGNTGNAGYDRRDQGSSRGGYTKGRGRGLPIRRSENRVLVSGLPPTGSWQDLKDHMREAGEVLYADVYKDGTAVCEFANHDDLKWAVKYLDDSKFKSHENETSYIRVKHDGTGSRSPSPQKRPRSRSRSHSRSHRRRSSRSSSDSSRRK